MKHLFRFTLFWLPAFLASFLPQDNVFLLSLKILSAFIMLFTWPVCTAFAAMENPRNTMGGILLYFGFNLLLITNLYSGSLGRVLAQVGIGRFARYVAGSLSFMPMDVFIKLTINMVIPHEMYILLIITATCLIGWLIGFVYSSAKRTKLKADL